METVVIEGEKVRRQQTKNGKLGWRLRVYDPLSGRQPEERFWGTERQAIKRIDQRIAEVRARTAPTTPHAGSLDLETFFKKWLFEDYVWEVKPHGNGKGIRRRFSTWSNAKTACEKYLIPALGPKAKMRLITTAALQEAIGSLTTKKGEPLAPSSKRSVATIAKILFAAAVKARVIMTSPAADLDTRWGSTETSRTALIPSLVQAEKLATAMDETWLLPSWCRDLSGPNGEGWGDIVRLMLYTGLRVSELFGANHLAYVPQRAVLQVSDTVTESGGRREYRRGRGKSMAAMREVMVIPQAVAPLERMLAIRERGLALEPARAARRAARNSKRVPNRPPADLWTLIVNGEYGGFMSYGHWRKKLTLAQDASGVTYTAHELRHVFASLLYAAGLKEDAIAFQMGHSSPEVARRVYRHMFKISGSEVAKRVGTSAEIITAQERAEAEKELRAEDAPPYDPDANE